MVGRRLAVEAPHRLAWLEETPPSPGPGQALLKPLAVGLCGSDLHVYEGLHPFVSYPVYPGHEVAARVLEVGPETNPAWVGARVTLEPSLTCGRCPQCQSGRYNICQALRVMGFQAPGGMAEAFLAPVDRLHRLPEGLTDEQGALVEPLAVAVHAVGLSRVEGRRVAVLGAGTIGLLVAQVARAYGAASVVVVDPLEARRRLAEGLGLPAQPPGQERYEVVFECVGSEKALEAAIQGCEKGAEVVVAGVFSQPTRISAALIQDWELSLRGSLMYTARDYPEALRLLAQGQVRVEPLITHRFPLREAPAAFATALRREQAVKVMLLG
ncbi:L-galactonate-5-dehydrogenase [Meiothermus luteus]|jgi:L-iditol 2-dehydrogenase|uniref:L-galactonate-5-dehydrogenase n=1 Tax=Meiothermus luteus TaxID=2026184 RepID=A0A399EGG3_9DEIN|nr:alcohol dehydrogenase catalytic domain-containing protein [Meiothermus luteus]RIH82229.1 L-galactonate-5-dehydrogenase [Meiothermus luteus]RMH57342.1 MAG: alcohol dehydrogenase [Deinococcota bacterium]